MTKKILQYIKTLITCTKYTLGTVIEEAEDSLCIYHRSGYQGTFEYYKDHSTSFPLTVIYTGNGNYTETEEKIYAFYNAAINTEHHQLESEDYISIVPNNDSVPQFLGKNEAGFYQWALDINIKIH